MVNINQIQHGDILLRKIDKLPDGGIARKRTELGLIIAEGEMTGHHHIITAPGAELMELEGQLYLDVTDKEVTITHEEHKPLTIPQGVYQIGRVLEYDYLAEMKKPVVD